MSNESALYAHVGPQGSTMHGQLLHTLITRMTDNVQDAQTVKEDELRRHKERAARRLRYALRPEASALQYASPRPNSVGTGGETGSASYEAVGALHSDGSQQAVASRALIGQAASRLLSAVADERGGQELPRSRDKS